MKPKTKQHYEILKLHDKLPEITDKQIQWAYKKLFKFYIWKTKHKAVCFECGHAWALETTLITKLFPVDCPKCKRKLENVDTHAWRKTECDCFQIITMIGGYQVIRVVQMYHWCMKTLPAKYSWHEIYQHWISPKGTLTIMSTGFNGMGIYCIGGGWSWNNLWELRSNYNNRYFINQIPTYPRKRIHPYIYRNGFTGEYHNFNPGWFFHMLLSTPLFETFLKTRQYGFLKEMEHRTHAIKEFWPQIRICFRKGYIINDVSDWFDYLNLLKHFHKNIFDPDLVCPKNLRTAHNALVAQKRAIDERNRVAAEEKRLQENIEFKKAKKKLMDLIFTEGNITIVPLKNVMDFKTEEKILAHCVYSSDYHKKVSSFIMSARVDGKRTETIEISLKDFRIMQCRGYDNLDSKYHKQILEVMQKNLRHVQIRFNTPDAPKKRKSMKEVA